MLRSSQQARPESMRRKLGQCMSGPIGTALVFAEFGNDLMPRGDIAVSRYFPEFEREMPRYLSRL
jgi:hypothetical protein